MAASSLALPTQKEGRRGQRFRAPQSVVDASGCLLLLRLRSSPFSSRMNSSRASVMLGIGGSGEETMRSYEESGMRGDEGKTDNNMEEVVRGYKLDRERALIKGRDRNREHSQTKLSTRTGQGGRDHTVGGNEETRHSE